MDYKQQIKSKLAIFLPLSQNYKTWEMNNAFKNYWFSHIEYEKGKTKANILNSDLNCPKYGTCSLNCDCFALCLKCCIKTKPTIFLTLDVVPTSHLHSCRSQTDTHNSDQRPLTNLYIALNYPVDFAIVAVCVSVTHKQAQTKTEGEICTFSPSVLCKSTVRWSAVERS